ncbi:MAG: DUF4167 domain-containing protein [Novosphingobium sp.]|nr:DUF4167 domain-containing protein [Novosphingobium sp.]
MSESRCRTHGSREGEAVADATCESPADGAAVRIRKDAHLNNNRGNNRRRGRGNNRPQGGGQQVNRIDSRARGNAPQMLEKYRKLAHDAHLNGDRVTAEYYLQFADHYFRVIADTRVRQEEQRLRRDERWQEGGEAERDESDENDEPMDSDFPSFDQPPAYVRRDREDRPERGPDNRGQDGRGQDNRNRGERPERSDRPERAERPERTDRPARGERPERAPREAVREPEPIAEPAVEAAPITPADNPFVVENRGNRGLRPRREDRRPRAETPVPVEPAQEGEPAGPNPFEADSIDPGTLPPAIAGHGDPQAAVEEAAPAPRRRGRPRRQPTDENGEVLRSVG